MPPASKKWTLIELSSLPNSRKFAKITNSVHFYQPDRLCKYNHLSPRLTRSGQCIECCKNGYYQRPKEQTKYKYKPYNLRWAAVMAANMRRRSRVSGLYFDTTISPQYLRSIAPLFCPVLGIKLDYNNSDKKKGHNPNSPSLDRINPDKGYTKDNIIIVSDRVNRIKGNASIDELIKISKFYEKLNYAAN